MSRRNTLKLMIDMADIVEDQPCDMLIVCFLSHGKDQGKIISSDGLNIDMETDVLRLGLFELFDFKNISLQEV